MAKTDSVRMFPEDRDYFDNQVNGKSIQNRPQAISITIAKAEKWDKYCSALENDVDNRK